jgi:WD40 repeat protein
MGLDTCIRKPLVVTCGLDKSVRVWNYVDKSTDIMKIFPDEAYSVAFHPSGLHLLVGDMLILL